LAGCTVSPGFDFRDFELASRIELVEKFPQHKKIIEKLTRQ
jgi:predicted cupin superfamily sugar epimerase